MEGSSSGLDFIILGASISGLAAAIALRSSGHNVLVLEKESQLGGKTNLMASACARVPPNGAKILFDWGLDEEIKKHAAVLDGLAVYNYDGRPEDSGRDFFGTHLWDPELLSEARGNFLQFRHQDLLRILYDAAVNPQPIPTPTPKAAEDTPAPRVSVLFDAEAVSIDCDACTVTLRSGETHVGDAIIGAGGVGGLVRRTLMGEEGAVPGRDDVRTGLAVYGAVIPKSSTLNAPDLACFSDFPGSTAGMGSNRGAMTFAGGEDRERDITLFVYTPDSDGDSASDSDGTWGQPADRALPDILGTCDAALRKLVSLAGPATCVPIKDHYNLKSWVAQSGRVVALGEAAHPFPPGSLHTYSVALEDGAFIGKIFSHTRSPARIPEFLHAFQEHRQPRCARILTTEKQYIGGITLSGEGQTLRNAAFRANTAAGRDVMDTPGSDVGAMMDDTRITFDYDPADDAEEWWVSWGRFREMTEEKQDASGSGAISVGGAVSVQRVEM
ncbi:hypothetical protein C8R47DRAFT_1230667 [Mycena vitilis]|nr:hypothetical protein C8R47DRAFT_1230667 [Mycena vitilis]